MPTGQASRKRAGSNDSVPFQATGPLASPHRAGHYSGLHPEDQPFQSSFFWSIQRQPELAPADLGTHISVDLQTERPAYEPPEEPAHPEYTAPQEPAPTWIEPARAQLPHQEEQRERFAPTSGELAPLPASSHKRAPNTPIPLAPPPATPRKAAPEVRPIPLLLIASLICFLVATGLLAFLLVEKGQADRARAHMVTPQLMATPGELRIGDTLQLSGSGFTAHQTLSLTHDEQIAVLDEQGHPIVLITDAQGNFKLHLPITSAWSIGVHVLHVSAGKLRVSTALTVQATPIGPPRLQLGTSHLDLGAGNSGTSSPRSITLTNAGGGQVSWTAQSNVPWLSLNPTNGTFFGNTTVTLIVNRAHLAPQAYLGEVTFTQSGGPPQTLHISMVVNTLPANLNISTASLAFAGTPVQSPAGQTLVLQNSGGQTLDWTVSIATTDGASWLSLTPNNGILAANTAAVLTVNVMTSHMAPGTYQGTLSFSYPRGPVQQVAITSTVNPPPQPGMHLAPQSLNFTSNQGTNPAPQSFTISNTGNAPLNWSISADANGTQYLSISPVKGSVPPGQSATVSIAPLLGNANGTINSTLTVMDSDAGTSVPNQQLTISIAITSQPAISVTTGALQFTSTSTTTTTTKPLTFSNPGSRTLSWAVVESASVPWLTLDAISGTLVAGASLSLNVTCNSSGLQPGTYTVTLTLKNTDASAVVTPQNITVTLVVSG